MQPHYDQASHEKATLSIDISPLGFYNEVLKPNFSFHLKNFNTYFLLSSDSSLFFRKWIFYNAKYL